MSTSMQSDSLPVTELTEINDTLSLVHVFNNDPARRQDLKHWLREYVDWFVTQPDHEINDAMITEYSELAAIRTQTIEERELLGRFFGTIESRVRFGEQCRESCMKNICYVLHAIDVEVLRESTWIIWYLVDWCLSHFQRQCFDSDIREPGPHTTTLMIAYQALLVLFDINASDPGFEDELGSYKAMVEMLRGLEDINLTPPVAFRTSVIRHGLESLFVTQTGKMTRNEKCCRSLDVTLHIFSELSRGTDSSMDLDGLREHCRSTIGSAELGRQDQHWVEVVKKLASAGLLYGDRDEIGIMERCFQVLRSALRSAPEQDRTLTLYGVIELLHSHALQPHEHPQPIEEKYALHSLNTIAAFKTKIEENQYLLSKLIEAVQASKSKTFEDNFAEIFGAPINEVAVIFQGKTSGKSKAVWKESAFEEALGGEKTWTLFGVINERFRTIISKHDLGESATKNPSENVASTEGAMVGGHFSSEIQEDVSEQAKTDEQLPTDYAVEDTQESSAKQQISFWSRNKSTAQAAIGAGLKMFTSGDEKGKTSLLEASRTGDAEHVFHLIEAGVDVNHAASDGSTAIIFAAKEGHLAVVQELIRAKADVNHATSSGSTAITWAAENGHSDVVQELIRAKADVNHAASDGSTAIIYAAVKGHLTVVQELIRAKADVNHAASDGSTAIIYAAEKGHLAVVQELIRAKADVNHATSSGSTAIIFAAVKGHLAVVQELIRAKADVNHAASDGSTAIIYAAENGHSDVVQELIRAKADVNHAASSGSTAIIYAAVKGHLTVVQELIRAKADVNHAASDGSTAIIYAAENGHSDVVQELIRAKADVNHAASDGSTAIIYAAVKGHLTVVQELIRAKADVNHATPSGFTAIGLASLFGHLTVVNALLEAGAVQKK